MVPAFPLLWGTQDDVSLHRRRYTREGLVRLARAAGLEVERAWFFNCALFAPILVARRLIRLLGLPVVNENEVNSPLVNRVFERIFGADARLSLSVAYPFGVSLGMVAHKRD
jgi:hypothetical protein